MKSLVLGALAVLAGAGWAAAEAPAVGTPQAPYVGNGPVLGPAAVPAGPAMPGLADAVNDCGGASCSVYFSADYLLWRVREGAIPQTATSAPVGVLPITPTNQFLPFTPAGAATTGVTQFVPVSVISTAQFGPRSTDYGSLCGFRLTGGWWADSDRSFGLEASYFMLERGSDHFAAQTARPGSPFAINTGVNNSIFVVNTTATDSTSIATAGGATAGSTSSSTGTTTTLQGTTPIILLRQTTSQTVGSSSNNLYGAELNARCVGLQFGCVDFGWLVGGRWIRFHDSLDVASRTSLSTPAGVTDPTATALPPVTILSHDSIRIDNDFIGGQIGADVDAKFGSFFVYARVKMGVGTILQHANVASSTQITGSPAALAGGNLFGPGDVGDHDKNRFGFVDELNLKFGYQITDYVRAYVGYDGLYLGHFARAGASSTTNSLNTSVQVAGSGNNVNVSAPAFRYKEQDVWVQGLSFGVQVNY